MKLKYISYLGFLFGINFVLRYPLFPYEHGSDSFGNHVHTLSIMNDGYYGNYINFFSYFGLYPGSVNSGSLFLLASFSSLTSLSVHSSIFLLQTLLVFLSASAFFLFSYNIHRDILFALISAVLYTTSRDVLIFTTWTFSFRGLYLSLFPLFLLFAIRSLNKFNIKEISFFILYTLLLFSIHRMAFFNLLIFISMLLVYIHRNTRLYNFYVFKIQSRYSSRLITSVKLFSVITLYMFILLGYTIYTTGRESTLESLRSSFFNDDSIIFSVLNLGIMHSMSFGLLIIFAPIGLINVYSQSRPHFIFLQFILLFFSFLWVDGVYGVLLFIALSSILVSLGIKVSFEYFLKIKPRRIPDYVLFFVLVAQVAPEHITVHETEHSYIGDEDDFYDRNKEIISAYNTGLYIRENTPYPVKSHIVSTTRLVAFSNEPLQLHVNNVTVTEKAIGVTPLSLFDFLTGEYDYIFKYEDDQVIKDWYTDIVLENRSIQNPGTIRYIDEVAQGNGQYVFAFYAYNPFLFQIHFEDKSVTVESVFFKSINENTYKFYSNGFHDLNFINTV